MEVDTTTEPDAQTTDGAPRARGVKVRPTVAPEPRDLASANQAIHDAWRSTRWIGLATALVAVIVFLPFSLNGPSVLAQWWQVATQNRGSWEPSGLLALLVGTGVTLFLGIQIGQATGGSVGMLRAVVLFELAWPVQAVGAILAWMTVPLAWVANGNPIVNLGESVLAALFLCMLLGFGSPSADRRAYQIAYLTHQLEIVREAMEGIQTQIGAVAQRPPWSLWLTQLGVVVGIGLLAEVGVAVSNQPLAWKIAMLPFLLGWPALGAYWASDAMADAYMGDRRGGRAVIVIWASGWSLLTLSAPASALSHWQLALVLFVVPVIQMAWMWSSRHSASARALTYRTLGARLSALQRDLDKARVSAANDTGSPSESAADPGEAVDDVPAAHQDEVARAVRSRSWQVAVALATGSALGVWATAWFRRRQ
jgi:hypothetical protein